MKIKLLDVASEVCGYTKDQPRNFGIKICMKLFVERENYLGFGSRAVMRRIGGNILRQKNILRENSICGYGSNSSRSGGFEKSDLCWDGRELFRITKQRVRKKKDVVGVSCLKDQTWAVKVRLDSPKNLEVAYGKIDKC